MCIELQKIYGTIHQIDLDLYRDLFNISELDPEVPVNDPSFSLIFKEAMMDILEEVASDGTLTIICVMEHI